MFSHDLVSGLDGDSVSAVPVLNSDGRCDNTGRCRVTVPTKRDESVHSDLAFNNSCCRERNRWQCHQRLVPSEVGNEHTVFESLVRNLDAPLVECCLGGLWRTDTSGAPPRLSDVINQFLHDPFTVRPSGRARHHAHPVMLSHRRKRRLNLPGCRVHHGRHPVHPPRLRGAAQLLKHFMDRRNQMGLIHRFTEHGPEPGRARQSTH